MAQRKSDQPQGNGLGVGVKVGDLVQPARYALPSPRSPHAVGVVIGFEQASGEQPFDLVSVLWSDDGLVSKHIPSDLMRLMKC